MKVCCKYMYRLVYRKSVKKELHKLPSTDRKIIVKKITGLAKNPHPNNSTKLKGSVDLYRFRHGNYRVIYKIENSILIITIVRVAHRRDVYKNL